MSETYELFSRKLAPIPPFPYGVVFDTPVPHPWEYGELNFFDAMPPIRRFRGRYLARRARARKAGRK